MECELEETFLKRSQSLARSLWSRLGPELVAVIQLLVFAERTHAVFQERAQQTRLARLSPPSFVFCLVPGQVPCALFEVQREC
jgi:hypothetical protein